MRPLKLTPVAFLLAGTALVAQTVQTGAIVGLVRDSAGKPVSGAIIIARSGQTERRTVTAENGTYRLPLVNVGKWHLTITHPGLQTHTAQVQVKINDTQTANVKMAPLAEATVVVVDNASSLDVTTTNISITAAAESVAKMARDLTSIDAFEGLLNQTAGIQVNPGSGEFYVRGAQSNQNVLNIDGTSANGTISNSAASSARLGSSQTPLEFVDSVEVVTGAFGAEYGALGGVVNALTKSGSNTWEGQVFYSMNFPNSDAEGKYNTALTPPQSKPAIQDQYYRYGSSLSGPILKDKLFFFVGYQGFKDRIPPAFTGTNLNGLTSSTKQVNGPDVLSAKINWFINSSHQLIYSFSHSTSDLNYGHQYPNDAQSLGTYDDGISTTTTIQTSNLTWNWLATPSLYLVASIGNYQNPMKYKTLGESNGTDTSIKVSDYRYYLTGPGRTVADKPEDYSRIAYISGTSSSLPMYTSNPNRQYRLDVSWQVGDHQIKGGYLLQKTSYHSVMGGTRTYTLYNADSTDYSYDITDMDFMEVAAMDMTYKGTLETYYLKDVFEIRPGLRLDAGLRYDPFKYVGASGAFDGMELASYRHLGRQLQPRIGLTWDVDNDGKKKVYAHWGRFFDNFSMSTASWATTSAFKIGAYAEGTGYTYNPDYQGNGPAITIVDPNPYELIEFGSTGSPSARAQRLELPHKDAFTLGGDWAYSDHLTFGAVWTYWDMKNVVEDSWFLKADGSLALPAGTNADGSPLAAVNQKVLWNPRPGPVTILDGNGQVRTWESNFPEPKNRFIGLNLHAQYSADGFFCSLNYDWAHHYGNVGGGVPNSLAAHAGNEELDSFQQGTTKDFDFASSIASGNDETTPVHTLKGSTGYTFKVAGHRIDVTPSFTWQSGMGVSAWVNSGFRYKKTSRDRVFKGDTDTPVLIDNQRCNMGRLPSTFITDLSIQDTFKVMGITVTPNVSIMNVFNTRPVTSRETFQNEGTNQAQSVPYVNYGMIRGWHSGRAVTAGVGMRF